MTTEQYTRAVEISKRIKKLEQVKKTIRGAINSRLTYEYNKYGDFKAHPRWKVNPIEEILDKHDTMIRKKSTYK